MKKTIPWWSKYGSFSPTGESEWPHSGQVVRYYRYLKQWSQADLAKLLVCRSSTVCHVECRVLIDSFALCRQLVTVLEIPPTLLGLDTPSRPSAWWHLEYPSLDAGSDDLPHPGQVVQFFRERRMKTLPDGTQEHWSQSDLGQALDPQLTREAICQMENRNASLDSITRRRALSFLLNIPPSLLGLDTLTHISSIAVPAIHIPRTSLDDVTLVKYQSAQAHFWTDYFTNHGQSAVGKASQWIACLNDTISLANEMQKHKLVAMQSRYYGFIANVLLEQRNYSIALPHADMSVLLSEQTDDCDLIGAALLRRSLVYFKEGNFTQAREDIDKALSISKHAGQHVRGHVLLDAGLIHAYAAQDRDDMLKAMSYLKQSERLARSGINDEDDNFINFNLGMVHLEYAHALLAPGGSRVVSGHLEEARRLTSPTLKRRHVILDILEVQTLINNKEYSMATEQALSVLDNCKQIQSRQSMHDIEVLYGQLCKTPYKNEPALARLGLKLRAW